ncbi:hypothetical protein HQ590_13105, partial [bacterium]|nr:hypothetical protein [bacterium]
CRMIPPWGHQSRPAAELRQEKLDAIAIVDRALSAVGKMTMAEPDRTYFQTRLQQARDFAEAWLLTIEVVHPLYQIVGEHHDGSVADPRGALRDSLNRFRAHAEAIEQRWGAHWYRRFAPKMKEFAAAIPPELHATR